MENVAAWYITSTARSVYEHVSFATCWLARFSTWANPLTLVVISVVTTVCLPAP